MTHRTNDDCRVGNFEKEYELPSGTIRNRDGRDTRSDKKIGTIRKEAERYKKNKAITIIGIKIVSRNNQSISYL